MIKKNAANSKIVFVLFLILNSYIQQSCKELPMLGQAENLLPNYLNQLFQTVYNSENEKILLISESIDESLNQFFKIVFKISQDQSDQVYIGIIYKVQNNKGKITKFLQTDEIEEIQDTLGIPKEEILSANVCKVDMQQQSLNTIIPDNFLSNMQKLNKNIAQQKQQQSKINEQNQVQSQADQKQKIKVIESQDEGKIFIRKNPYNLGDVLSGSGENKIMNPVEVSNLLITRFNQGFQEIKSNQDLLSQLGSQLNMLQSNINIEQFQIQGLNQILNQNPQLQKNMIGTFQSSNQQRQFNDISNNFLILFLQFFIIFFQAFLLKYWLILIMFNVRDTNLEALKAKKSAVMKGYMEDNFINFFVPQPVKKEILMNRGYWIRSYCFRTIVEKFISTCSQPCQILSIGCGLDTLPFNMLLAQKEKNFQFFECDLIEVVQHKSQLIQSNSNLEEFLQQNSNNFSYKYSQAKIPEGIESDKYKLFPCNLNNIQNLHKQFEENGVKKNLPTLIISECVLIYLNEGKVQHLMQMFAEYFQAFAIMDYEMFNGNDGFGKMMVKNFKSRGIPLYSIHDFNDLKQIKQIYTNLKYQCDIKTIKDLYWGGINQQELNRINKLEWIDEFEEFDLMCSHYFISIAKFGNLQQEDILKNLGFELLQLIKIYIK